GERRENLHSESKKLFYKYQKYARISRLTFNRIMSDQKIGKQGLYK
ncbi:hypothetical protein AAUPMC_13441, partial [Pasteurella multocida subsp. multocida str. Anand1_cattle]